MWAKRSLISGGRSSICCTTSSRLRSKPSSRRLRTLFTTRVAQKNIPSALSTILLAISQSTHFSVTPAFRSPKNITIMTTTTLFH
ncbi:hypothetical protein LZ31DRAFT_614139 [Colletotrichum somersetense]|nr:hypothetical protein LZ31DRAFT_614139 [Colletotrichum somersetense]